MNFNSLQFLIFLPLVLGLYWLIPQKFRWMLLLAASYYFYMSWNAGLVFLIAGTTLVSYLAGIAIEKSEKQTTRRLFLVLTLVVCIGILIFFKYFNFLLDSVVSFLNLFTLNIKSFSLDLILPIGISFYTFQTLSYVIDVYRGKVKAEKHLGYYALFVSFFPQLVAGPIERPGDLIPQLKAEHKLNREDIFCGLRIMAVGFFYKCVVADYAAAYVNNVFYNVEGANALSVLLAGFLFTVQMYGDFAGYSEIATGAARMMGIRLSRNFYRPYLCKSYADFFRRWHITLTRWFTDYVYIPLGGNRRGLGRRIYNTLVVFALCGLWHGANWTYVLWGLYAGVMMSLEILLDRPMRIFWRKIGVNTESRIFGALQVVGMFGILIPAAIIFRADDLPHAGALLATLLTDFGFGAEYFSAAMTNLGLDATSLLIVAAFTVCELTIWHYGEIGRKEAVPLPMDKRGRSLAAERSVTFAYIVVAVILCWVALVASDSVTAFQYFQF